MLIFLSLLFNNLLEEKFVKNIIFRSFSASITSTIIVLLIGPYMISLLKKFQGKGQPIRLDGPKNHLKKSGTPTMGGIIILISFIVSSILWCDLRNSNFWIILSVTLSFGLIGFYDDYIKVKQQNDIGLSYIIRLNLEFLISFIAVITIMILNNSSNIFFPIINKIFNLGILFVPFSAFVIVGTSNAVNLTDGLDGLAIFPFMISIIAFILVCFYSGNQIYSSEIQISSNELKDLSILFGAVFGASLGFLWFNANPATIFMGDTGSLSLGAFLGVISVVMQQEILLCIVGGIFVVEIVSVIIQIIYFKITRKRFFLMSPLHHHFEKKGWKENQIVIRFWIISTIFVLFGLLIMNFQ